MDLACTSAPRAMDRHGPRCSLLRPRANRFPYRAGAGGQTCDTPAGPGTAEGALDRFLRAVRRRSQRRQGGLHAADEISACSRRRCAAHAATPAHRLPSSKPVRRKRLASSAAPARGRSRRLRLTAFGWWWRCCSRSRPHQRDFASRSEPRRSDSPASRTSGCSPPTPVSELCTPRPGRHATHLDVVSILRLGRAWGSCSA